MSGERGFEYPEMSIGSGHVWVAVVGHGRGWAGGRRKVEGGTAVR